MSLIFNSFRAWRYFLNLKKLTQMTEELQLKVLREVFHQHVQISSESLHGFLCNQCGENGRIETFEANSNLELEDEFCSMGEHAYSKDSEDNNLRNSPTSICRGEQTFEASESSDIKVVNVIYN